MYLLLSRSIAWPFGRKQISILDNEDQTTKNNPDQSPPLISNRDLASNTSLSKNFDENRSLIESDRTSILPPPNVLSALGKHYLTREDLENMIQLRMSQETPLDRVERFLWKE